MEKIKQEQPVEKVVKKPVEVKKEIKKTKHHFPLKDSTFRNKDLIEGIKVIFTKNVTMSKVTKKFEKTFSKKMKVPFSTMVNSGSSANLLAFQCLINPYFFTPAIMIEKNVTVASPAVTLKLPVAVTPPCNILLIVE